MAHEVEVINGVAQMAYVVQTPWHGLGKRVPADLSPDQMLVTAGLDWNVEKRDIFLGDGTMLDQKALVRSTDNKYLSMVSERWNPVQNQEAFEFFNDFVTVGGMEMHTAGSLKEGKMVWALAKIKDSFELFGGDQVDNYLLFSNPHEFGKTVEVKVTPIRVVCNNTLTYALNNTASQIQVRLTHHRKFDGDLVKQALGISKEILETYRNQAEFLGSKRYTDKNVVDFFNKIFPGSEEGKVSRKADNAAEILHTQPGAKFAEGTYWSLFNTVTYMVDHKLGRTVDSRLSSSWFGGGKNLKQEALRTALEMAEAA